MISIPKITDTESQILPFSHTIEQRSRLLIQSCTFEYRATGHILNINDKANSVVYVPLDAGYSASLVIDDRLPYGILDTFSF